MVTTTLLACVCRARGALYQEVCLSLTVYHDRERGGGCYRTNSCFGGSDEIACSAKGTGVNFQFMSGDFSDRKGLKEQDLTSNPNVCSHASPGDQIPPTQLDRNTSKGTAPKLLTCSFAQAQALT